VRLSAHRTPSDDDEVRIDVSDSGLGIPSEHLPHSFDRFYRVDRARSREMGGAGLGLAVAHELVAAHGGEITVHSIRGERSTITVHLQVG
jgi:signal transduction histidine kinase